MEYPHHAVSPRRAPCGVRDLTVGGAVGSSYDNLLAEINGLYNTELSGEEDRGATSTTSRSPPPNALTGPTTAASTEYCGDLPPAEIEAAHYDQISTSNPLGLRPGQCDSGSGV